MQISEKELEDYIFDDLTQNSGAALLNRGLYLSYHWFIKEGHSPKIRWLRQLDLGPYGRLDIVGYYRIGRTVHIELFELKVPAITTSDIEQICRYEHAIRHYWGKKFTLEVHKYLVGKSFDSGHYIHNLLYDLIVVEYEYDLSGISFLPHTGTWCRNEPFNAIKSLHNAEEIHGYR